ncbi:zinc finger protein 782-like [Centruroides sculpturatus]|uniref:zinc finger protein 782-like n=1 Tax=Centruroides sculpturatus TaxID=218467 RepID=UPI000C6DC0D6|nr:zinc finger protein 782-like [Centruroides sculpturatus]
MENEEENLECKIYKQKFPNNSLLEIHEKNHCENDEAICKYCNKRIKHKNNLSRHMKTHYCEKSHKCHLCDYASNRRDSLKKHVNFVHRTVLPSPVECSSKKITRKKYQCETCHRFFKTQHDLEIHIRRHENIMYTCGECGKPFSSISNLTQHFIKHSSERRHKCKVCGKMFKRKGGLKKHLRGHAKKKSYNSQER